MLAVDNYPNCFRGRGNSDDTDVRSPVLLFKMTWIVDYLGTTSGEHGHASCIFYVSDKCSHVSL